MLTEILRSCNGFVSVENHFPYQKLHLPVAGIIPAMLFP